MFEYKQWILNDIAEAISSKMEDIDSIVEEDGQQEELLGLMRATLNALELAKISVTRLDWYLSGDDDFETYKQRLNDEIVELLGVNEDKEQL